MPATTPRRRPIRYGSSLPAGPPKFRAARQRLGKAHWLWPHRKPKQKPKPKRDDMNDEIPFVLAAVAMIPLLAMLAGSGTLL